MRLVVVVVAGDQSRQHAGIRRVHLATDHRQAHAWHLAHAEAFQYRDVAVPAPHEHQVLDDRGLAVLHGLSRSAGGLTGEPASSQAAGILASRLHWQFSAIAWTIPLISDRKRREVT